MDLLRWAPGRSLPTPRRSNGRFAQDEDHELTWATNNLEGTEPEMLQKVTDLFVAANPNYKVTVLKYDGTTYDQKLLADIVAGTLPDLFVSADVFTKPFFDSGLTADLVPLAEAAGSTSPTSTSCSCRSPNTKA